MKLPPIITQEFQQSLAPSDVITILKEGNERFASNLHLARDLSSQRENLASAQYPVAVILGCIDSRTPSELIFDIGLGVVFNVRVAGNILNDDVLGSIEFACKIAGAKLIVVMGHTDCGAIKAACNGTRMAHITSIMKKIDPVICSIKETSNLENDTLVEAVTHHNTKYVKEQILNKSDIIKEMISANEVEIVSCVYSLETGYVNFD
jgi:carbonic anhydrase